MATPHSWSVHLLIDLLVADGVMELRSSDYHEQTGCLFAHCGLASVSVGHVEVDTCTFIRTCIQIYKSHQSNK